METGLTDGGRGKSRRETVSFLFFYRQRKRYGSSRRRGGVSGGAEMEETERQKLGGGAWGREEGRTPHIGGGIHLHQVRYSLGTCRLSQMRGPVEGRLITMAADGGKKLAVER